MHMASHIETASQSIGRKVLFPINAFVGDVLIDRIMIEYHIL